MGYYTHYKLALPSDKHMEALREICGDQVDYLNSGEGTKWYNHDEDMLALSKRFPDVLFVLDGDGETQGDVWRKFYRNGFSEEHRPSKWVPPTMPLKV